ncbi:MAG: IS1 family transposase [Chitinophagales bacterium]
MVGQQMKVIKQVGTQCPRCQSAHIIKSGRVKDRQRFLCKDCEYHFTVNKMGKRIDDYYVVKALQLYLQGMGYRQIERILGVSHVTVMKWVKQYFNEVPQRQHENVEYEIMNVDELSQYMQNRENLDGYGYVLTHLGCKMLVIKWQIEEAA